MRETIEREVKLVPADGFELSAFGPLLPPRAFVSTYHDTADLRLAQHGVTLRYRSEDGAGAWQLKIPHGAARIELEEPGPPARPPAALVELLTAYLRGNELVQVARLRTRRQRVRVDGAEIVEDAVAVLDGQRIVGRFRELEVELLEGDEKTIRRLERELQAAGAEPAPFVSKLHHVLGLAPRAGREGQAGPAGAVDVVREALVAQHDRLLAHDPGARLGRDPEDIHQMRVASRRARAFLRAARPRLDREWARALGTELGWLGSALGPVRDLDVLLEHLRAEVATLENADAAGSLVAALEEERGAAREAVLAALTDERYLALLDALETAEPVPAAGADEALADLWWGELRRTRRRFERLDRGAGDDELHAARIQVKRARYAAELAAHELGRPGERFVAAAKRLQDVLGEHQDACVAEAHIRAWAERESPPRPVIDDLLGRERRRRRKARRQWPAAWAELVQRARKARRT